MSRSKRSDRVLVVRNQSLRNCCRYACETLERRVLLSAASDVGNELSALQPSLDTALSNGGKAIPFFSNSLVQRSPQFIASIITAVENGLVTLTTTGIVKSNLANALGNGPSGIHVLVDTNGDGNVDSQDVHTTPLGGGNIQVEMLLHKSTVLTAFNLSTGLTILPVNVSGSITPTVGFDYELAFQYNTLGSGGSASLISNVFMDTYKAGMPHHEMQVTLSLDASSFSGTANFGLVQGSISAIAGQPNGFTGVAFSIDGGSLGSSVLSGEADLNLHLRGGFGTVNTSAVFPSIGADLSIQWPLASTPTVQFKGVTLDLGTFLGGILHPIIKDIQSVTNAMQPVFDVLNAPLPGISDLSQFVTGHDVTLLTLGKLAAQSAGYGPLADFIAYVDSVAGEVNQWHLGDGVTIPLGGFDLNQVNNGNLTTLTDASQLVAGDLTQLTATVPQNVDDFLSDLKGGNKAAVTFSFPIFDDPKGSVFKLLLGQDADLVDLTADVNFNANTNDMPGLSVAGVGVTFDGSANIHVHLEMGYDTHGISEFLQSGTNLATDALDGFFIRTNVAPLIDLKASLSGGPSFNFGIVSIGIGGTIATGTGQDIQLSAADTTSDHKFRLANLDLSNPFAWLSHSGTLVGGLGVFIKIGVTFLGDFYGFERDFGVTKTLLDFGSPPTPPVPTIAKIDAHSPGQLDLLIGMPTAQRSDGWLGSDQRVVPGNPTANVDGTPENYIITHIDPNTHHGDDLEVDAFGVTQTFHGISLIVGASHNANLSVNVGPDIDANVNISGGTGTTPAYPSPTTNITDSGDGDATLAGGAGDSVLIGGKGFNLITGGNGNDQISSGPGFNIINGGAGNNRIDLVSPGDGILNGGGGASSTNTLEMLAPQASTRIDVTSNANNFFVVNAYDSAGHLTTQQLGSSFQKLIIGGGRATTVNIGDLSATGLQNISLGIAPSTVPTGAMVTPDDTGLTESLDKFFSGPGPSEFTDVSFLHGSTITVTGSAVLDNFYVASNTLNGNSDLLVSVISSHLVGGNIVHSGLAIDVGDFTTGEDLLTLDGRGGGDDFDITVDPKLLYAVNIDNSGPVSNESVSIDASLLNYAGDATVSDSGVALDYLVTGFVGQFAVEPHSVFDTINFGTRDNIIGLTVRGSYVAENFTGSRTYGTNYFEGGPGDDSFTMSGDATNDLNGENGSDHYVIDWDLTQGLANTTIGDTGTTGTDSLEINDAANSVGNDVGGGHNTYTISAFTVTRDGVPNRISAAQPLTHASLSYGSLRIGSLTLDTANGLADPLSALIGPNYVNISATSAGLPLTINTGDGFDVVSTTSGNLDSLAGAVTINGNANTTVEVDDTNGGTAIGNTTYNLNSGRLSRTRSIYDLSQNRYIVTTTPDISFNTIGALTLNAANTDATFTVNGTSGATQFVLNTSQDVNQIDIEDGDAVDGFVVNGSPFTTLTLHDEGIVDSTFTDLAHRTFTISHSITDTINAGTVLQTDRTIEKEQHIVTPIFDDTSDSTFAYNNLGALIVDGSPAGSIFNVNSTSDSTPVTINPASGIAGSVGHDIVVAGGTAQQMDNLFGTLTVNGGPGTALSLDDSANANRSGPLYSATSAPAYVVNTGTLFRTNILTRTDHGDPAEAPPNPLEQINYTAGSVYIFGGPTTNTYNVEATAPGSTLTITAGNSNDVVNLGTPKHLMDPIGNVTVVGGYGTTLNLDDAATADHAASIFDDQLGKSVPGMIENDVTWTIRDGSVTRDNVVDSVLDSGQLEGEDDINQTITFSGLYDLAILDGPGDSTFNVLSMSAQSAEFTDVRGGGGFDNYTVGGSGSLAADISSPVGFLDNTGNGTLVVDDANNSDPAATTDDIVHVTPSQIGAAPGDTLFGPGGYVSFAGVSNVTLNTGSGSDTIYLRPSALTEFTVNASEPEFQATVGDALIIAGAGATNPNLESFERGTEGDYTFDNRLPVNFTGMEQTSLDNTAPVVVNPYVQFDTLPLSLVVPFSQPLLTNPFLAYYTVTPLATGAAAIPLSSVSYDGDTAIINFPGKLADGNYHLNVSAGAVSNLDGNLMQADAGFDFFSLAGDANHDRFVNTMDFIALAQNFNTAGGTFSQGDFNYDGKVNALDFNILAARFGTYLPATITAPVPSQSVVTSEASHADLFSNDSISLNKSDVSDLLNRSSGNGGVL